MGGGASSPAGQENTSLSKSWGSTGISWIWSGSSFLPSFISGEGWNMAHSTGHAPGQQHPIRLYLVVWAWLFILSTCSYMVDYFQLEGGVRYSLILLFMILKAGLIVAVFMHMAWERLS